MDLNYIINKRRVYRSLDEVKINKKFIKDLRSVSLASNNQPWRFIFVLSKDGLNRIFDTLPLGNIWAKETSLIIAVIGREEEDCILKDGREYYLFDIGIVTAFLILKVTEQGSIVHPIAGFSPEKVKKVLEIFNNVLLITLIIVGKHSKHISENSSKGTS